MESWKKITTDWLEESNNKYPEDNFAELWLPEYPILDDSINDNFFMPKLYVIAGNTRGNIELARIINSKLVSSFTIGYCEKAYRIQSAHGFAYPLIYNPIKEC